LVLAPEETQTLYRQGVDSVAKVVEGFSDADWAKPACGEWSGTDTARHLLSVAWWYHDWLDRALAGELDPPFPASRMDDETAAALAAVPDLTGSDAVVEFTKSARTYLERATEHWYLPFAFPYGLATVGLHCGAAASEWNVHAWDLSRIGTTQHQPANADRLLVAAGNCLAHVQGGMRGAIIGTLVPLGARRSPWKTMLKKSGRHFDPS
jgi:hypothetical protein